MARKVNRKELCEAIRQGQARMKERMDVPDGAEPKSRPQPVRFQLRQPAPQKEKRPRKPLIPPTLRHFRLNVKPKYLAAAAAGLFFIIAVILLGSAMNRQETVLPTGEPEGENTSPVAERSPAESTTPPSQPVRTTRPAAERTPYRQPNAAAGPSATTGSKGDNVVVIATFNKQEPLVPVMEHFNANGIATEMIQRGSYYMVVTKERYESSERTASTGRRLLRQISEIGARYKAPPGYASFTQATFDSAYFRKL